MERNRHAFGGAAVVVALCLSALPAVAAEQPIDDFSDASALTQFVPNTNVVITSVGSTVRVDPNLTGVIGQVRQLTVTATALGGGDFITSGVSLAPVTFLEYNSTVTADGAVELLFDRNGGGLNASLGFAQGIEVVIADADAAAVFPPGLDITVTLTDGNMHTASSTQTVTLPVMPMTPLPLQFPFSSFAGIDPDNLFSIRVVIDPQIAGDLRLDVIQTYGTPLVETVCNDGIDNNNNGFTDCQDQDCVDFPGCATQAPSLSPLGLGLALKALAFIALAGLRRRRRPTA
jgi:hypothetical protein